MSLSARATHPNRGPPMRRPAWLLLVGLATGCVRSDPTPTSEPPPAAEPDETLVVYSLEPKELKESDLEPGETLFRGWLILGSTPVTDAAMRKEVLNGVAKGIED